MVMKKKHSIYVWTLTGIIIMLGFALAATTITDTTFNMGTTGSANFSGFLYINSTNVGIGTSNATEIFEVVKNFDGNTILEVNNVNAGSSAQATFKALAENAEIQVIATSSNYAIPNAGAILAQANTNQLLLGTLNSGANITFYTGTWPTESMRLTSAGRLGIGTSSPLGLLEILNIADDSAEVYIGRNNPAVENTIGAVNFIDKANLIAYGGFSFDTTNVSSGSEGAKMILSMMADGTSSEIITSEYSNEDEEVAISLFDGFAGVDKSLEAGNDDDTDGAGWYISGEGGGERTTGDGDGFAGGDLHLTAGDGSETQGAGGYTGGSGGSLYLYGGEGASGPTPGTAGNIYIGSDDEGGVIGSLLSIFNGMVNITNEGNIHTAGNITTNTNSYQCYNDACTVYTYYNGSSLITKVN